MAHTIRRVLRRCKENLKKVKKFLFRLRQREGLSLQKLSEMTGIGKSTLGNYECGKTSMSQDKIEIVAKCLKTTAAEIDKEVPSSIGIPADPPETPERVQHYIETAKEEVMAHVKALQQDNEALRKRVEMLEAAFKLIPKVG